MQLGDWQLDSVSGGRFFVDGGTMFGVVPKVVWQRLQPADELNRIRNATHCVLARRDSLTVLVDTGYGGGHSDRDRRNFQLEDGEPLVSSLAALGVAADEVQFVVLSHLHFDHAGGATTLGPDGAWRPTFPNATYLVQRAEWDDARSNVPELRGAYFPQRLGPLLESGQLRLIDGDVEILPGLRSIVTGGHTRGHQALAFSSSGQTALFPGDLCPMTSHVRSLWGMSYDMYPLDVRRRKPQLLGQAADEGWWILWDHDPDVAASRLVRDAEREFAVVDSRPAL